MATRRPIVNLAGALSELPAGDSLSGGAVTTVDDTAPSSPSFGDRWIQPATGIEAVWVPATVGGAWFVPTGQKGEPGGNGTSGTGTVNFGAFPGTDSVTLAVTGVVSITATSLVRVWLTSVAQTGHSEDELLMLQEHIQISVPASSISAGVGFSVSARCSDSSRMWGLIPFAWEFM